VATLDLGDILLDVTAYLKGTRRGRVIWRIGEVTNTTKEDRAAPEQPGLATGKVDAVMDLQADKKVSLSLEFTDEVGNPTSQPDPSEWTATFTVDNTSVINLTDNGDGTAVAAAVGAPGLATVHVDVTWGATTLTGDLQINVVPGLAERINISAGEPIEVTP
jgi:hypothetical protein